MKTRWGGLQIEKLYFFFRDLGAWIMGELTMLISVAWMV